jgi:uncharacterized protein (UPF0305 family)
MDKQFKSIVDELNTYVPTRNKDVFIEGRAQQVIASARNLIRLVQESYDPEVADDLTKRLLSAIKNDDTEKFCRKIRQIRESKDERK